MPGRVDIHGNGLHLLKKTGKKGDTIDRQSPVAQHYGFAFRPADFIELESKRAVGSIACDGYRPA